MLGRKQAGQELRLERRFRAVLSLVENGKDELVRAVPTPRGRARPFAECLHSFEVCLGEASSRMDGWHDDAVAAEWNSCREGLAEGLRRAERLRVEAPSMGYESLVATIAELIAPLEVFEDAERRVRRLRVR